MNATIKSLEGLYDEFDVGHWVRGDAKRKIVKCATVAKNFGYKLFAVKNGGLCYSDENALNNYQKYGSSNNCKDGIGLNDHANHAYRLVPGK